MSSSFDFSRPAGRDCVAASASSRCLTLVWCSSSYEDLYPGQWFETVDLVLFEKPVCRKGSCPVVCLRINAAASIETNELGMRI